MAQSNLTPSRKDAKTILIFAISAALREIPWRLRVRSLGCLAVILLAMLILRSTADARQQAVPAGAFEFDVASVRSAPMPTSGPIDSIFPVAPTRILPGDRFDTKQWLRSIIAFAYGLDRPWDHIRGGGQILDEIFAVSARGVAGSFAAPSSDGLQPVQHMVRRLLADRFNLAAHVDQEERRVLLLKRASSTTLGPALRLLPDGCAGPRPASPIFPEDIAPIDSKRPRCGWGMPGSTFAATGVTLADFARDISVPMEQEVVDETGLSGVYAFDITFDKDTLMRRLTRLPMYTPGQFSGLPSFTTVLKSDLGLVLEPAIRLVPVLVITHIEPLREN